VFYETGYAHALEKRVILLTQSVEDIPFDLRHHFHIVYNGSISMLKDELTKRLRWFFSNSSDKLPNSQQLEFYIAKQKIVDGGVIANDSYLVKEFEQFWTDVSIDINNASSFLLKQKIKLGVILISDDQDNQLGFGSNDDYSWVPILDSPQSELYVYKSPISEVLPGDWVNFTFRIYTLKKVSEFKLMFRVFTELGYRDLSFVLTVELPESV
jgi:hypothetical protein